LEAAIVADGEISGLRPSAFVPLDEHRAVRIYQRNLPHWRQQGCTYFLTFRLGDSIPDAVHRKWEDEQRLWLKARGIHYGGPRGHWRAAFERMPKEEQWRFQRHFNRQVQSCLDRGLGECWLGRADCVVIVRRTLLAADGDGYHLGDFVIMPNHVHALITPIVSERDEFRSTERRSTERNEFRSTGVGEERNTRRSQELEMLLKRIKGNSAVECNHLLGRAGTFWQADSYDHIVRSLEQLHAYREYIGTNPSEARIAVPASARYRAEWMDNWFRV
jgi:putative transposase